ncbi:hypothetical protein M1B35_30900 [Pseudomonas sp. MAFF 302046]|uniref:YCII-related domain-containing protein n=1 Tax=Pseudomonas morbosilactucae TaxID=2938197 RepID=A0ABT0JR54_9PSED|nr:hypothetical protein [Pseudomonas morbosilactucae]MCK9818413.1 hypothetical protein [Pseudomonas morbosilactucae]
MKLYYVIAEKDLYPQYPHHADWPKQIAYCLQDRSIMLTEGKGHGLAGSVITLPRPASHTGGPCSQPCRPSGF